MRQKLFILLFLFLLPGSLPVLGQTPVLKSHLLFRGKEKYTINVIYQDLKGLIWFGTDRGLFRYDGINYNRFTAEEGLSEDNVTALTMGNDGVLWIGHKNGKISLYDGLNFSIFKPEEGTGNKEITDIVVDSAAVTWYSTSEEGVFRYDGRYLTNINTDDGLSDNTVYDIEIDREGTLWFATDYGFTRFSNNQCEIVSMKDGLSDNIVRVIKAAKDGRIWMGTQDMGLTIYNPEDRRFSEISGWDYGVITGFVMSLEKNIWISTQKQGIVQLNLSDSIPRYRKITKDQGLVSDRINTIIKDQEENIWIGGYQGAIQALPPVFEFLNKSNGSPFEMIYCLINSASGNMWVCTESGLYRGIPDESGQFAWTNLSEEMNLMKVNFISLYLDPENKIWAGTYGDGVFRINPDNLSYKRFTTRDGLSDNNVSSISGSNELVWFSTFGGGINSINLKTLQLQNYTDPELKNSYIYQTVSDKTGKTWIAGTLKFPSFIYRNSLFHAGSTTEKLPQLYSVAIDSSGGVWFNTKDEGILHLSADTLTLLGDKEGINLKEIQSIIFDNQNNLILVSDFGLMFYHPTKGVILTFGESSGLAYHYPLLNSVYSDSKGQVWIGTQTGIIKYNPEYLRFIDQKPRVFLSVKNLFSTPIRASRKKFRYNENNFTFGYTGIWFRNPEAMSYRYMLEGYDMKWNYSNRNQTLPYSKLPAGSFTFRVEVSLDGKSWFTYQDSSYSFKVTPPFWERWWFIISMILLTVSGVLFYIRKRLSNLEKAKAELELEVYKRTEEIRSQNEELETQKEEIETQRDHAQEQRDQIEAQKNEIQASIRYAHRIQSAALPPKKQLDSLLNDYFILNKPRDIVSGDFFWVSKNGPNVFFAVGDCTGHGVPGAFMSMLGLSALNDIVKSLKECKASTILYQLRGKIRESLHQGGESETVANDGMDISLCIWNTETRVLQFAAAHNPLYIIRNGELMIIEADSMEIGSYLLDELEFTNHEFHCMQGDHIYLFSDGYADQFGGPDGKKYKYRKFREFLVSNHHESLQRQKWLLDEEIEAWKGLLQQVDDIMVMGVKID